MQLQKLQDGENLPHLSEKEAGNGKVRDIPLTPVERKMLATRARDHSSVLTSLDNLMDLGRNIKADISAKRLQFNATNHRATPLGESVPRQSVGDGLVNPESPAEPKSSLKRGFEEVEKSPEQAESHSKKNDAVYKRCFQIPESTSIAHTGLTGIFSIVGLDDKKNGPIFQQLNERMGPKQSSPVAKTLFCDLEDQDDDQKAEASLTSPRNIRSLDSDDSAHEMSLVGNTPQNATDSNKKALASSFVELDENEISAVTPVARPAMATPKHSSAKQLRGEFDGSLIDHGLSSSMLKSPGFLKPKNVVAFRSYCSSINRSSNSHLSLVSLDGMETSTSASFYSAASAVTPVQKKRPSLNSSLYQVS